MNHYAVGKWITITSLMVADWWIRVPYSVQILILLMGLDIVSGIFAAIRTKSLNSSIMVRGLVGKLAVFPLLALLHLIEKPLSLQFEFETVAAVAFIVYESMSIVENSARAGVPIPLVIVSVLAKAKIQTATEEDIKREFSEGNTTKVAVEKTHAIIETDDSSPNLKVDKTVTTIEEQHVTPVDPKKP